MRYHQLFTDSYFFLERIELKESKVLIQRIRRILYKPENSLNHSPLDTYTILQTLTQKLFTIDAALPGSVFVLTSCAGRKLTWYVRSFHNNLQTI